MSSTPLNRAFDMNGEIDAYSDPENGTKLKLVKKNNQIILQGQMPTGYDPATNNYIYKDIYSPIDNQTGGIELQQFIKNLEEKIKAMNTDLQNSMNG